MNTIYFNGKIYVEREKFVDAMLVSDGLVQKIGTLEEVMEGLCPKCEKEMVDLEGKTVIPGLNDSHLHIGQVGAALSNVALAGTTSLDELIERGKAFIASHTFEEGDVVGGWGWNQDYFTDEVRMPTRYDLDKISTEVPIIFTRACGHICVANSKALEIAGVTKDTVAAEGGVIYTDENGEPNGLFSENAQVQIACIRPEPTAKKIAADLSVAMAYAASNGLTSLQSNDLKAGDWETTVEAFDILYKENPNALRVYEQSTLGTPDNYRKFLARGHKTGAGNDMFKYGPLKMFVDGSLGARTAYMRQPYADDPSTVGVSTISPEAFQEMVNIADENGCQVATHCIGDAAIELVLNAYSNVIDGNNNKNRHSAIHAQITDNAMVQRFLDKDILAQVQPIFINYDMNVVAERCGQELADQSYAFGSMYRMGIHTSYGTDSPVEDLCTWDNIYCAVTRKTLDGKKTYRPDQCVDIYDAIDQYTIGSAYASFDEDKKGRLMPGFFADFAVLDRDIFTIPSDEIRSVKCLKTVLGGKVIFERK